MTLLGRILLGVVAMELLVGGAAIAWKVSAPRSPLADLSGVDAITAGALRQMVESVRTPEDWRKLGEAYMSMGFFRESEACHRVAAERNAGNAETVQQWALALERLGSLDDANGAYARAAKLDPARSASCNYLIGRNELRQEDVPAARQAFQAVREPPAARYELARLLLREGKRDQAVAELNSLTREFPAAHQPLQLLHLIALEEKQPREALAAADRQDAADQRLPSPFDADVQKLLAVAEEFGLRRQWHEASRLLENGQPKAAEQLLRGALASRFDGSPADWLAESLFQQGRVDESVSMLEELIQRQGPRVEYLERLGDTLDAVGRQEEARAAWRRAIALSFGPPLRDVHGKLAASLADVGQQQLSTQQFALTAQAAGIGEFRAGNLPAAETALREAVRLDSQLAHAWYYLGEVAFRQGDLTAARSAYQQALSIQPHHGRAADRLDAIAHAE